MEVSVNVHEIINWFYSDYKDKLVKVHTLTGTLDQCFKKMYALRRSARYDNARRYDFEDKSLEEEYRKWKDNNETIDMYYKNSVVD